MFPKYNKDFIKTLSSARRCTEEEQPKTKKKPTHVPPKSMRNNTSPYSNFLNKYNNLEEYIDGFKTRDFVYYFRQIAEDSGYIYVISNMKKDMAIMKRLQSSFSPREICGMIEFLYQSEQDYLDKNRLSPNLLASQWVNTIYADTMLWIDDKYEPKSAKNKKAKREWSKPIDDDVKIGEW